MSLAIIARYDVENSHVYVGDSSGQITVLKVTAETSHQVDVMKKHTGNYHMNCCTSQEQKGQINVTKYICLRLKGKLVY